MDGLWRSMYALLPLHKPSVPARAFVKQAWECTIGQHTSDIRSNVIHVTLSVK